jgi:hypothetical protein
MVMLKHDKSSRTVTVLGTKIMLSGAISLDALNKEVMMDTSKSIGVRMVSLIITRRS